jgi:small subunit ribosomal protein S8
MSLQDPIADMLTRIRNAQAVSRRTVQMPYSNLKFSIAKVLEKEGYLLGCQKIETDGKLNLLLNLKYYMGIPVIRKIQRASRPGLRLYEGKSGIPKIQDGLGVVIISTPKGLMTDRMARLSGLGGELLCYVC